MNHDATPLAPPSLADLRFQYQPVAPLRGDEVGWHEALVRWHLPDGTIRGPLEILPYWLAPQRQATFTRYTIEQAAARLQAGDDVRLSVNLSPRQLTHPSTTGVFEDLQPHLRERLIVELTEQRYRDVAALRASLSSLAERCRLVLLDDVTVEDLARGARDGVPVDGVKLDRSVLAALLDADRRADTGMRIRYATERYPIVVAEGVEDPAVADALAELGVTHVQGFGLGRPAPNPGVPPVAILPRGAAATGTRERHRPGDANAPAGTTSSVP